MLVLRNDDVARLLDHRAAVETMRRAYQEYREGQAGQIPRADLYSPSAQGDAHRLGTMAGTCRATRTAVVRVKSDVVRWGDGREHKHAARPGLFSGVVLVYDTDSGSPLAIIQDGVLQHLRVGAAAALGTDMLWPAGAESVAVLGTGGMADAIVRSMVCLRPVARLRVWSPTRAHRQEFAERIGRDLDVAVSVPGSAEEAVRGADVVVCATDALEPPLERHWVASGAHVTCVSRREVDPVLRAEAALVACLGPASLPVVPGSGAVLTRGGYHAYLTGDEAERGRIPRPRSTDEPDEYPLMLGGRPDPVPAGTTLLVAVGTQGVQFAATAGAVVRSALSSGIGATIPEDLFLQDVRT